ncbi:hypothetical protein ACFXGA_18700 [Actinosynnema sp. NPDC059335]|uniref:hypothetical protein n=1 Tax=Actinosynnema sp. NPDC059335 TaxID=3346804 RepID=UPI00367000C5
MKIDRLAAVTAAAAVLALAGCAGPVAPYEERMGYLRKVAAQGAETHGLLRDQDAPKIDKDRCLGAWIRLQNPGEIPSDLHGGGSSLDWRNRVQEFFVDSCVSGKPKLAPGDQQLSTAPSSSAPAEQTPASAVTGG